MRFLVVALLCAAPQGGTVVDGTASIATQGRVTTITQSSQRAILHWDRFESAASETIRFDQPGAAALTLNRVVGVDPSFLGGALQANGRLFILNPNGIVFGPNAVVNVGSLVASTLNMTDADLRAGNFVLLQNPTFELSSVINRGQINAPGGTVALIAPIVDNSGTIVAAAGRVVIRASTAGTVDGVNNGRTAFATGRNVRMAEVGLTALLEDVVNTASVAGAARVERLGDGTVFLRGAGGIVTNSGTIDAGTVEIQAELALGLGTGSRVRASGAADLSTSRGALFSAPAGPGRAVVEGDAVRLTAFNGPIKSDANGALEVRGRAANLDAIGIGEATAPVRVNTARVAGFSSGGRVQLISDGSVTVDDLVTVGDVDVSAAGSILAGTGRTAGLIFSGPDEPVNIFANNGTVRLRAGGAIGAPATPLSVAGPVDALAPGGVDIAPNSAFTFSLPSHDFTVATDTSVPRPRASYNPPSDPIEVAPAPVFAGPPVVAPATADVVLTVAPVIGAPDTVVLSANRAPLIKGETDVRQTETDNPVETEDEDKRKR